MENKEELYKRLEYYKARLSENMDSFKKDSQSFIYKTLWISGSVLLGYYVTKKMFFNSVTQENKNQKQKSRDFDYDNEGTIYSKVTTYFKNKILTYFIELAQDKIKNYRDKLEKV